MSVRSEGVSDLFVVLLIYLREGLAAGGELTTEPAPRLRHQLVTKLLLRASWFIIRTRTNELGCLPHFAFPPACSDNSGKMPAIAPGSKVLVTGANGYLAVHVVKAFLERGHSVRGTVRSQEKGAHLHTLFSGYGDKFETVVVKDITQVGRSRFSKPLGLIPCAGGCIRRSDQGHRRRRSHRFPIQS